MEKPGLGLQKGFAREGERCANRMVVWKIVWEEGRVGVGVGAEVKVGLAAIIGRLGAS